MAEERKGQTEKSFLAANVPLLEGDERLEFQVRTVVAEACSIPFSEVLMEQRLGEDLDCDSLDIILIWQKLEDSANVRIPKEMMMRARTVGELIGCVAAGVKAN